MNNDVAAFGVEPGAAIFMSVFFIKIGLVAVGAEQDVWQPVRRSAHLFTDRIQVKPSRVGAVRISTGMAPRERRGGLACKIAKWKTGVRP